MPTFIVMQLCTRFKYYTKLFWPKYMLSKHRGNPPSSLCRVLQWWDPGLDVIVMPFCTRYNFIQNHFNQNTCLEKKKLGGIHPLLLAQWFSSGSPSLDVHVKYILNVPVIWVFQALISLQLKCCWKYWSTTASFNTGSDDKDENQRDFFNENYEYKTCLSTSGDLPLPLRGGDLFYKIQMKKLN